MNKSLIRFLILPLMLGVIQTGAFADFSQHFDMGQSYLTQYRYSDAISEFKSALKINYMDTSARVGLINSFLARGTDYANKSGEYEKAADDFRAALFYLKYLPF